MADEGCMGVLEVVLVVLVVLAGVLAVLVVMVLRLPAGAGEVPALWGLEMREA